MIGLGFDEQPAVLPAHPHRMDIPCFVGFVGRRAAAGGLVPVPAAIGRWLDAEGWTHPESLAGRGDPAALLDVPVPIESWDVFDRLFAWDQRPVVGDAGGDAGGNGGGQARRVATWLGGAVRAFFQQGGRKCYVVRVADPTPLGQAVDAAARAALLIPGFPLAVQASPHIQAEWRGAAHVHGLPEAAFLCMPDLPEVFAGAPAGVDMVVDAPEDVVPEGFVECAAVSAPLPADLGSRVLGLPRCDQAGYLAWSGAVALASTLIREHRPDMHLLAALPVPARGSAADGDMIGFLTGADLLRPAADGGVGSAFVQLAYPWPMSARGGDLPGGVEPPDAVLAGLLARSTLERGSHRSVARQALAGVFDTEPRLSRREQLEIPATAPAMAATGRAPRSLLERVSLLGPTASGVRMSSDVTTSVDEVYRPACVGRILAALIRACQDTGTAMVFDASGELVWARIRAQVEALLLQLFAEGALHGASPAEAFSVRCDRSTMTQNDLDSGRVLVEVTVRPAAPIERIDVVLAVSSGGRVSLAGGPGEAA